MKNTKTKSQTGRQAVVSKKQEFLTFAKLSYPFCICSKHIKSETNYKIALVARGVCLTPATNKDDGLLAVRKAKTGTMSLPIFVRKMSKLELERVSIYSYGESILIAAEDCHLPDLIAQCDNNSAYFPDAPDDNKKKCCVKESQRTKPLPAKQEFGQGTRAAPFREKIILNSFMRRTPLLQMNTEYDVFVIPGAIRLRKSDESSSPIHTMRVGKMLFLNDHMKKTTGIKLEDDVDVFAVDDDIYIVNAGSDLGPEAFESSMSKKKFEIIKRAQQNDEGMFFLFVRKIQSNKSIAISALEKDTPYYISLTNNGIRLSKYGMDGLCLRKAYSMTKNRIYIGDDIFKKAGIVKDSWVDIYAYDNCNDFLIVNHGSSIAADEPTPMTANQPAPLERPITATNSLLEATLPIADISPTVPTTKSATIEEAKQALASEGIINPTANELADELFAMCLNQRDIDAAAKASQSADKAIHSKSASLPLRRTENKLKRATALYNHRVSLKSDSVHRKILSLYRLRAHRKSLAENDVNAKTNCRAQACVGDKK